MKRNDLNAIITGIVHRYIEDGWVLEMCNSSYSDVVGVHFLSRGRERVAVGIRRPARFDPLWQDGPFKKRNAAYRWLSEQMELPIEQTHIGMFTVEQCKAALEIINKGVSV